MPTYCFRREDSGELIELFMSVAELERRQTRERRVLLDDGTWAARDVAAEHAGFHDTPGNWPKKSWALAVHPDQRKDATEASVRMGVPTEFDKRGYAVFRDRNHRKRYCEASGFKDLDAGYGDSAGR